MTNHCIGKGYLVHESMEGNKPSISYLLRWLIDMFSRKDQTYLITTVISYLLKYN